jgi:hypothetical protein
MLAVIDPCLFDVRDPVSARAMREVVGMLRSYKMRIPDVPSYWPKVVQGFLAPLSKKVQGDPEYDRHIKMLLGFAQSMSLPELPPRVSVWDFKTMFLPLGEPWLETMRRIVSGCVLSGEDTVLVTRLIEGRNMKTHPHGKVVLEEKTCWNLRVRRPPSSTIVPVWNVVRARNMDVKWTCRYDDRLPSSSDNATFPFCPSAGWEKSSIVAFRVHESRPAWLDSHGNYWARPSTGAGHHWDVYLDADLEEEYGLGQLNIVEWGAPPKEGAAGSIHHVPAGKKGRLNKRTGWTC